MINFLNANEGVIAMIGVIISIIIAIIGFCINKNISKITQNQNIKNNSKGLQGVGDVADRSITFNNK
jgi:predicted CDP-diglyceride synthetase/phosphatidate cytidylyltransferase